MTATTVSFNTGWLVLGGLAVLAACIVFLALSRRGGPPGGSGGGGRATRYLSWAVLAVLALLAAAAVVQVQAGLAINSIKNEAEEPLRILVGRSTWTPASAERTPGWGILALLTNAVGGVGYLIVRRRQVACTTCGLELSPAYQVCPRCGARQRPSCPSCGQGTEEWWQFCPYCGRELGPQGSGQGQGK